MKSGENNITENMKIVIPEEQLVYSKALIIGIMTAFFILVISFVVYISGMLHPSIPISVIPKYWNISSNELCNTLHTSKGWTWLSQIDKSDCLNFIGITSFATLTILCYLLVLPIFIKKKDIPYIIITILQILVLLLAASGILIGKTR